MHDSCEVLGFPYILYKAHQLAHPAVIEGCQDHLTRLLIQHSGLANVRCVIHTGSCMADGGRGTLIFNILLAQLIVVLLVPRLEVSYFMNRVLLRQAILILLPTRIFWIRRSLVNHLGVLFTQIDIF